MATARTACRWKVAARTHPVPDLVEVAFQIGIELIERLPIYTSCTLVGFDRFICFVHLPFLDLERLACYVCRCHPVIQLFRKT